MGLKKSSGSKKKVCVRGVCERVAEIEEKESKKHALPKMNLVDKETKETNPIILPSLYLHVII